MTKSTKYEFSQEGQKERVSETWNTQSQNSVELGWSAKGLADIKSIKVYMDDAQVMDAILDKYIAVAVKKVMDMNTDMGDE